MEIAFKSEAMAISVKEIKRLRANKNHKALREAWDKEFPPLFGIFTRNPPNHQVLDFWYYFVEDNTIRGHYMRDGWLSGIDYGDA